MTTIFKVLKNRPLPARAGLRSFKVTMLPFKRRRMGIGREAPDSHPPKSTHGRGHFDAAHAARNLLLCHHTLEPLFQGLGTRNNKE